MDRTAKKIAILGSTGSIGQQTLDIVQNFPKRYHVVALAGGQNTALLTEQVKKFRPSLVYSAAKFEVPSTTRFATMEEIASYPEIDLVVIATSGKEGLAPTLAAIRAGKTVALANKEVLVMAGEIVIGEARKHKTMIIPIDSEHSAIWQCLQGERNSISRVTITASGGPFYHLTDKELANVTVEDALKHPTWKMGRKITIDSATLMNKGLEVIEAHWLFSVPFDKISIVFHPQSIVHAFVEFADGSVKAQLSLPDMRLPIQYALSYPERIENPQLPRLDIGKVHSLVFERIDCSRFPCLQLALEAGKKGGTYPTVLCAADEIAVNLFLKKEIGFLSIGEIIERTINLHRPVTRPTLKEILAADEWARETALRLARRG